MQAQASLNQAQVNLESHDHPRADRRRRDRAQRRRRTDGRREHAGADAVHDRERPVTRCGSTPASTKPTSAGSARTAGDVQGRCYPNETFTGTVSQVRLQPVAEQNVVSYVTVIDVPNPDLKLKPGMTATVTVETARADDVLRVPNAALRFQPAADRTTRARRVGGCRQMPRPQYRCAVRDGA